MNCEIHNKPMKQNRKGWYCSTPIEKDANGNVTRWCEYKPAKAPITPAFQSNVPKPPDATISLLEDIRHLLQEINDKVTGKGDIPF